LDGFILSQKRKKRKMIFQPIHELAIIGVVEPGIANKERIVLRPTETTNMGMFSIHIGKKTPTNMVIPYHDNYLWPGELVVQPPSWIYIYTGPGTFQKTTIPGSDQIVYIYHWGKNTTVFNHPDVVPYILRISGITIGPAAPHSAFPQITS
jgi:hypothetical protein